MEQLIELAAYAIQHHMDFSKEQFKTIKMALNAKLDSANWTFCLSAIVLSLNTMFKKDLQGSAAELLFGQCLRLPGGLVSPTFGDQSVSSSDIINIMRSFTESL